MAVIERISTSAPWEPVAGYSRAVKAGEWVAISGTTATDERGALVGVGQMYVQAHQAITNLRTALERLGLSLRDVVRTRMFVTDISRFEEVARAHRDFFGEAPPASTLVEVRRLVHPDMLIEIEADAYAGQNPRVQTAAPAREAAARPLPKPSRAAAPRAKIKPKPRAAKKPAPRKPARRR